MSILDVIWNKKKKKDCTCEWERERDKGGWAEEDVVYEIQQRNGSLPLYSHEEIPETFYLSIHVSSHPVTQLTQSF